MVQVFCSREQLQLNRNHRSGNKVVVRELFVRNREVEF